MTQWIYVLGERSGGDIKVGITSNATPRQRVNGVNKDQTNGDSYVMLCAVRGERKDEDTILRYFTRKAKGSRTEYLEPTDECVEYVNWLRAQWFTTIDMDESADGFPVRDPSEWLPDAGRRHPPPVIDPTRLVQDYEAVPNALGGTSWSWMINPRASFQDYFTPCEIVNAAREAMGDIDLDPASHWGANKEHKIPHYYDRTTSAFDNPWFGRVWLNPPYGENGPWFDEIVRYVTAGEVSQLCMLSPMWAFTTRIARPVIELSSAMIVLSPTPKFWGNENPDKVGSNQPHAIIYIGDHPDRFTSAMRPFGIPARLV